MRANEKKKLSNVSAVSEKITADDNLSITAVVGEEGGILPYRPVKNTSEGSKVPLAVLLVPSWMTASPNGKNQVSDETIAREKQQASVDASSRTEEWRHIPSWWYAPQAFFQKRENADDTCGHSRSSSTDSVRTQPAVLGK